VTVTGLFCSTGSFQIKFLFLFFCLNMMILIAGGDVARVCRMPSVYVLPTVLPRVQTYSVQFTVFLSNH
jgi:hypothetical protein